MFFRKEKIEGKFLKIAREHDLVLRHLDTLDTLCGAKPADLMEELKDFLPVFEQDMIHHFKIEERFLMPAALLTMPSVEMADLVLVLQKEHGTGESDMKRLREIVETRPADSEKTRELARHLVRTFRKHADTEMNHLFPKMDADEKCRKMIEDITLES